MAIHYTEEQLDNIERACIIGNASNVLVNSLTFKALLAQAREAIRIPHLEHQLNEQVRDKIRIADEYHNEYVTSGRYQKKSEHQEVAATIVLLDNGD